MPDAEKLTPFTPKEEAESRAAAQWMAEHEPYGNVTLWSLRKAFATLDDLRSVAKDAVDALAFWTSDDRERVGFPVDRDGVSEPDDEAPFVALRAAVDPEGSRNGSLK